MGRDEEEEEEEAEEGGHPQGGTRPSLFEYPTQISDCVPTLYSLALRVTNSK